MKLTSEFIQINLEKLESLKRKFQILVAYENEIDDMKLNDLFCIGKTYGLSQYLSFIDFIRQSKKNGQQPFYDKKISIKEFKEVVINCATDVKVKSIIKSKGVVSFQKFINSPKWDLYTGNKRRRRGLRYHDNFVNSQAIIANFCIQNQIDIQNESKIIDYYTSLLPEIDNSIIEEIEMTTKVINFVFTSLDKENYDFRRINLENLKFLLNVEIERKMKEILEGESVKLINNVGYYSALTPNKVYNVITKNIVSGRLTVSIQNDLGFVRSYPYRIFETVSNIRDSYLQELLKDL